MTSLSKAASEDYRLALLPSVGQRVLAVRNGVAWRLPRISIPPFSRTAQQITLAVRTQFQVDSIVLDFFEGNPGQSPCAVAEICDDTGVLTRGDCAPVDPLAIAPDDLSAQERILLRGIMEGIDAGRGPVSRMGWLVEAKSWIRASSGRREYDFTGNVRQLNGGGRFALVRLAVRSGPALWLKAVGEPNLHEYDTTTYLSAFQAQYLPPIVCARRDWHAWVMEEVGEDMGNKASFTLCVRAVETLAQMQIDLLGNADSLLSHGCAEHRSPALQKHSEEVFGFVAEAMRLQSGGAAAPLSGARVRELNDIVRASLETADDIGMPESIAQNDMNLGNVLSDGERCVFTDWCESYVGNPFNAFELFRVVLNRQLPASVSWVADLRSHYMRRWLTILSESQAAALFALTPVLTIYSCLYSRGHDWITRQRDDPAFQRRTRTLARHLDRAVRTPEFVRAVRR